MNTQPPACRVATHGLVMNTPSESLLADFASEWNRAQEPVAAAPLAAPPPAAPLPAAPWPVATLAQIVGRVLPISAWFHAGWGEGCEREGLAGGWRVEGGGGRVAGGAGGGGGTGGARIGGQAGRRAGGQAWRTARVAMRHRSPT